jgi:hypothetical protein
VGGGPPPHSSDRLAGAEATIGLGEGHLKVDEVTAVEVRMEDEVVATVTIHIR